MPILRVEQAYERPLEVELSGDIFSIGRSSFNNLAFDDLSLSRQHARILRRENRYVLEDTGSRNGTFLNGTQVFEPSLLNSEDSIRLGDITIRFLHPESERLQVTDTMPIGTRSSTFMIETDEIDFRRYADQARAGILPIPGMEHIWAAVNQAAAAMITYYSIDQIVEVILDIALQAVPADEAALVLLNENNPEDLQIKSVRKMQENENVSLSRTLLREVLKNRKAVLVLDAQSDVRLGSVDSIRLHGIRSTMCVPLWKEKRVIGLIYMANVLSERIFTQADLHLIALVANMAAVKIENAVLVDHEMEKNRIEEQLVVAAQVQRRLLPQAQPRIPGYQVFGTSETCYMIGGDYYDFIEKDDHRLAVVIADVAGKGVAAALLMAVFQATLRALARSEKDIGRLIGTLNKAILDNSPPNKFITAFYGELDYEEHTFEYINAGHNAPILVREATHTSLVASCPIMGVFPDLTYASRKIDFLPGDLLFLYTDGITEAANVNKHELGTERITEFLLSRKDLPVEMLSQQLEEFVREYTRGASMTDDSTVIFLKRSS